jgi:hypothetical protein
MYQHFKNLSTLPREDERTISGASEEVTMAVTFEEKNASDHTKLDTIS